MPATESVRNKWMDFQVLLEKSRTLGVGIEDKPILSHVEDGFKCYINFDNKNVSRIRRLYVELYDFEPSYFFLGKAFEPFARELHEPVSLNYRASTREDVSRILDHLDGHGEHLDVFTRVAYVSDRAKGSNKILYAGKIHGEQSHKSLVTSARPALEALEKLEFAAIYDIPIDMWDHVSQHLLPLQYIEYAIVMSSPSRHDHQYHIRYDTRQFDGQQIMRSDKHALSFQIEDFNVGTFSDMLTIIERIDELKKSLQEK